MYFFICYHSRFIENNIFWIWGLGWMVNFRNTVSELPCHPHLKSCFWKRFAFFSRPLKFRIFWHILRGPTGPPKSKTPSRLATPLDDSVLFYFFVRRSLHFRDSEVSALVVSLGDICNRYIQYLNKVPIATIILHIWMGAKQFIYYLFLIYLLFIYYLFIIRHRHRTISNRHQ